jgi:hypothetical protein
MTSSDLDRQTNTFFYFVTFKRISEIALWHLPVVIIAYEF